MRYRPPIQGRAIETEQRFIESAKKLFAKQGTAATTIDDIANDAGLHRGAFLKRFGSKDGAKHLIFDEYCKDALCAIARYRSDLESRSWKDIDAALYHISIRLEKVQRDHFAANRAMYEDYACGLRIHEKTKEIFRELVELIKYTDQFFYANSERSKDCYYACAQLLVTLNFEYVLSAMPGLPRDEVARHSMIALAASIALSREASRKGSREIKSS